MECFGEIQANKFGYRKNTSCRHAHFLLNETINYFRQGGSKIHVISLDATKAFDRLWRDGLFFKLIDKTSREVWRILYLYYQNSKIRVKLDGTFSDCIRSTEGVKQGGILSPFLFNFYINGLLTRCLEKMIGACINTTNLSILAYCDTW